MSAPQDHPRLCVGLTGGIGSGKSTVARLFAEQGAAIVDADEIAHQLTQANGLAIPLIRARFGQEYLTSAGTMDRNRMRQLIFSDNNARGQLEGILHPLILEESQLQLSAKIGAPYVILMAPLLLENRAFLQLVDRILVINCTEQNQIYRVMQRSRLDEPEIRAIIAQQISSAERLARADDIIQNDGTPADLICQVAALHQQYIKNNN